MISWADAAGNFGRWWDRDPPPPGAASTVVLVSAGAIVADLLTSAIDGFLAATALIALVLVAPAVYDRDDPPLRMIELVLAVTASLVVVAELPGVLDPGGDGASTPGWWLAAGLGAALAVVIGKLLLLQRFSTIHRSKASRSPEEEQTELDRLLPFQDQDLRRISDAILAGTVKDEARVVQLAGRWGEGKSFLVNRLGVFLRAHEGGDRCAVVVVDVWKHQSEPDLHLSVVEEMLGNRSYWYPYGWLHYPLTLALSRAAKDLRLAVSAGSWTKAQLELPSPFPA